MSIHTIIITAFLVPLGIAVLHQDRLRGGRLFALAFVLSLGLVGLGMLYCRANCNFAGCFALTTSLTTTIYLILFRLIRDRYFAVYQREPVLSRAATKFVDIVLTMVISFGTVGLSYLIGKYLCLQVFACL